MPSASIQLICSTGSSRTRSDPRTTIRSSGGWAGPAPARVPGAAVRPEPSSSACICDTHGIRVSGADVPQRAIERRLKPLVAERLEEVVDGVRVECAQRVLVVRRHEDDLGHRKRRRVAHERGRGRRSRRAPASARRGTSDARERRPARPRGWPRAPRRRPRSSPTARPGCRASAAGAAARALASRRPRSARESSASRAPLSARRASGGVRPPGGRTGRSI